jgi:5-methylcytosine-specific restriction endonuclease McrA
MGATGSSPSRRSSDTSGRTGVDGPRKRRNGEGSLFLRSRDQVWVGAYISRRDGKRKSVSGVDWREVERRLDAAVALSKRQRSTDRLMVHTRRARAEDWTERVLSMAAAEEWDLARTAKVIVAQLAPRRVRLGVFGPCAYCGTWAAGTVDHVMPTVRGGTSEVSNLVSACLRCNSRKNARTPAEWGV